MAKTTPDHKPKPAPGSTEEAEQELKQLASKAREETTFKHAKQQIKIVVKVAVLLSLAATYSNVSLLALSPVYGSIPSSIWHPQIIMAACFTGWSSTNYIQRYAPGSQLSLLGIIALYIPVVQFYLFKASGAMGAVVGPVVTELLTVFPLLVVCSSSVAQLAEDLDLTALRIPKPLAEPLPGIASYVFFRAVVRESERLIISTIGRSLLQTRLGLQILLGALFSAVKPSKLLRLAVPAVLHTAIFNQHLQSPYTTLSLETSLSSQGWTLIDRHESLTGYISVLESQNDGFRVMRCDHSLLGGEWIRLPNGMLPGESPVKEPIYAIFTMLEAIRLIEVPTPIPDDQAKALVM